MRISDWSSDVCSSDLEVVLRVVAERKLGRPESGDLARQLGADGAAGTRHQHTAALDEPLHGGTVEWCLRPAEQILDGDRADLQALLHAAAEVGQPRQAGYRGAVAVSSSSHVSKSSAPNRLGDGRGTLLT